MLARASTHNLQRALYLLPARDRASAHIGQTPRCSTVASWPSISHQASRAVCNWCQLAHQQPAAGSCVMKCVRQSVSVCARVSRLVASICIYVYICT
jgi:hypothetical protein